MTTSKVDVLSSYQSLLFCLDNVPMTYGKEQLRDAVVELLITQPKKCATELNAHLQKKTQYYKQLVLELIEGMEMRVGIFLYITAARMVLGEPILLIRPTEHISGTSTPYYTFNEEYCIPQDQNIASRDFKIHLVYNGWNHFTPFYPQRVVEIIRKGEPILRQISHALDGLKQLSTLVPKKCLLKSGLKSMIEHLEAANTVGKSCNFKFGTAETEMTEDVALPRDDTIVTGHSQKHSLPSQKGCEPSPPKICHRYKNIRNSNNSRNSNNRRNINHSYYHHYGNCSIANDYEIANSSGLHFDSLYFNRFCFNRSCFNRYRC